MGFGAVGAIMLIIVFIFYMRMVDARTKDLSKQDPIKDMLDQVEVFESLANDKKALELVNKFLKEHSSDARLLDKKEQLQKRLNDA